MNNNPTFGAHKPPSIRKRNKSDFLIGLEEALDDFDGMGTAKASQQNI